MEITISVDDATYERFTTVCGALGKDAVEFISKAANEAMANHLKFLTEEFDESA